MARIVIVEDEAAVARVVAYYLRKAGHEPVVASTGAAALQAAATGPELILLDLGLPDLQGAEVLRRLKRAPATAPIPVVIVSGEPDPAACVADGGPRPWRRSCGSPCAARSSARSWRPCSTPTRDRSPPGPRGADRVGPAPGSGAHRGVEPPGPPGVPPPRGRPPRIAGPPGRPRRHLARVGAGGMPGGCAQYPGGGPPGYARRRAGRGALSETTRPMRGRSPSASRRIFGRGARNAAGATQSGCTREHGYCVLAESPGGLTIPSIQEYREYRTTPRYGACGWFQVDSSERPQCAAAIAPSRPKEAVIRENPAGGAGHCRSYSNDGRGRYTYWNFSPTPHRLSRTAGCDRDAGYGSVYVVPDVEVDLFFWNGWWWRPWEGRWCRSRYYDRDWGYYDRVPVLL